MIIPDKFTIIVQPISPKYEMPMLAWKFRYKGLLYGNAIMFPRITFEDRRSFSGAIQIVTENMMDSFDKIVREGLEDVETNREEN